MSDTAVKYVEGQFDAKVQELGWQRAGLTWTRDGYGSGIASRYMIRLAGETRWRRVYYTCYSNSATHWIKYQGQTFVVVRDGELEAALELAGAR